MEKVSFLSCLAIRTHEVDDATAESDEPYRPSLGYKSIVAIIVCGVSFCVVGREVEKG